jgi:hypothetical protein
MEEGPNESAGFGRSIQAADSPADVLDVSFDCVESRLLEWI